MGDGTGKRLSGLHAHAGGPRAWSTADKPLALIVALTPAFLRWALRAQRRLRLPQETLHTDRGPVAMRAQALHAILVLLAASAVWAAPAVDRDPQPGVPTDVAPQVLLHGASERAEEDAARIRGIAEAVADPAEVASLRAAVDRRSERVSALWIETGHLLETTPRRVVVESLSSAWSTLRDELRDLAQPIDARAQRREADLKALAGLREFWASTLERTDVSGAPAPVVERIQATLAAIDATRAEVDQRRTAVLVLQDTVSRAVQACDDAVHRLRSVRRAAFERIVVRNQLPVWELRHLWIDPRTGLDQPTRLAGDLAAQGESLGLYATTYWPGFAIALLLWIGFTAGLRRAHARVERWAENDALLAAAAHAFRAPVSAAVLLALMLSRPLRPHPPAGLQSLLILVAIPAMVAVLRPLLEARLVRGIYALASLFVVDVARQALVVAPGFEQVLLMLELASAAGLLWWMGVQLRDSDGRVAAPAPWLPTAVGAIFRVLALGAAASVIAAALGFLEFADFVGGGGIAIVVFTLGLLALRVAAGGVIALAISKSPLARLRAVQRRREHAVRRIGRVIDVAAAGLWIWFALDRFELAGMSLAVLRKVLDAHLVIGALDLQLGRTLGFLGVVVAAYLASRLAVFTLEEDVYSRMALPRGVPHALSTLVRYALLLVGFFLALGTVGLDLTRLTVLVSAFGLGVGFGLQQIVNNFVSGLILVFERPVQVGDRVALGELIGDVTRIGIRSSTILTFQGAEVVVPNSNLIEEKVTNWTLSDPRRRVELQVGVAYGTEAGRVLALLTDVAKGVPGIVAYPAPEALFIGFGDSSLDFELRVWTDDPAWFRVRSDLGVEVQRALKDAGIEIPFPQRDVHVRSVERRRKLAPRSDDPGER